MALKDTVKQLRDLLSHLQHDLERADRGNKAASQRVRTGTVKLEKVAKRYRKESIVSEKSTKGKRPAAKKAAPKGGRKPIKSAAKHKVKGRSLVGARSLSVRRPTAKLPVRRVRWN